MKSNNENGRSMIEMLEVLTIIGVLSIGGIRGYSKAMDKHRLNTLVNEYSHIYAGIQEHYEGLLNEGTLTDILPALGIIPDSWEVVYANDNYRFVTSYGNITRFHSEAQSISFETMLIQPGTSKKVQNAQQLCAKLINEFAYPLKEHVRLVNMWRNSNADEVYYGDKYCTEDVRCLKDMTIDEMMTFCDKPTGQGSVLNIRF